MTEAPGRVTLEGGVAWLLLRDGSHSLAALPCPVGFDFY